MIVIPDTNCWQGNRFIDELASLQAAKSIQIGCSPEILDEIFGRERPEDVRAAVKRVSQNVTVWLASRKEAATRILVSCTNPTKPFTNFLMDSDEADETKRVLANACSISDDFIKTLRPLRTTEKDRRSKHSNQARSEFGSEFRASSGLSLPPTLPHLKNKTICKQLKKYLDPKYQDAALFLDRFLQSLSDIECSVEQARNILKVAYWRFPGLWLFYCHTMFNMIGDSLQYKMDRSYSFDAQLMLVLDPSCCMITSDAAVIDSNRLFNRFRPVIVSSVPSWFSHKIGRLLLAV